MLINRLSFCGNVVLTCLITSLLLFSCSKEGDEMRRDIPGFFGWVYQDSILPVELAFDLDQLIANKESEARIDASLSIPGKLQFPLPVDLAPRGVTRKEICDFPPIELHLSDSLMLANGWGDFDEYKIVTHCLASEVDGELLLREYITYRLYEIMTPISFRTQLLRVKYFTGRDTLERLAFMIEDDKEMGARVGLEVLDLDERAIRSVHLEHYKRFVLFQYMVGNTDWNLQGGHNTEFLLQDETNTPIVVPYDFDVSGLVNAPYARPYPTLPIDHVRERHWMYRGGIDDDFSAVVDEFKSKKETLFDCVQGMHLLSQPARDDIIAYLSEFYDIIGQPDWKEDLFRQ